MYVLLKFQDGSYHICKKKRVTSVRGSICVVQYKNDARYEAQIMAENGDKNVLKNIKRGKSAIIELKSDEQSITSETPEPPQNDQLSAQISDIDGAADNNTTCKNGADFSSSSMNINEYERETSLRKLIEMACVNVNFTDHDVADLSVFVGHAAKAHREHYRQPADTGEILRMSRVMELAQENVKGNNDDTESGTNSQQVSAHEDEDEANRSRIVDTPCNWKPRTLKKRESKWSYQSDHLDWDKDTL